MQRIETRRTPWHLWQVGLLSLAWNAFGANDYIQTQSGNLYYLGGMARNMSVTAREALAYFQGFPIWVDVFWALGVWGSVGGSVLLLLRSRWAIAAFALSLIGLAGTTMYSTIQGKPEWASGPSVTIMAIIIWSMATFLLIYALSMRRKGVLR